MPDDFVPETVPDDFQTEQVWPDAQDRNFFQRNIGDPLGRGFNRATQAGRVGLADRGLMSPETAAKGVIADQQDLNQYPVQPDDQAFLEDIQDESFLGAVWDLLTNPTQLGRMAVEQVPNIGVSAAGGALGGAATGAPFGPAGVAAGAAAGAGGAGFAQEYAYTLLGELQAAGLANDEETLSAALQDPAFMERARETAIRRGIPIAAVDLASAGLIGRIAGPAGRMIPARAGGELLQRGAGLAAETGAQAGFGSLGELLAQINAGQEINPAEIAMEGVLEVPGAVAELPSLFANRRNTVGPEVSEAAEAPMGPPPLPSQPELRAAPPPLPTVQQGDTPNASAGAQPNAQIDQGQIPASAAVDGAPSAPMELSGTERQGAAPDAIQSGGNAQMAAQALPEPPVAREQGLVDAGQAQPVAGGANPVSQAPEAPETRVPSAPVDQALPGPQQSLPTNQQIGQPEQGNSARLEPTPEPAGNQRVNVSVTVGDQLDNGNVALTMPEVADEPLYLIPGSSDTVEFSRDPEGTNTFQVDLEPGARFRLLNPALVTPRDMSAVSEQAKSIAPVSSSYSDVSRNRNPGQNTQSIQYDSDSAFSPTSEYEENTGAMDSETVSEQPGTPSPVSETRTSRAPSAPSETPEASRSRAVWAAIGRDPAKSELLPAGNQIRILSEDAKKRFGFKSVQSKKAQAQQAVSQLKDAHQSLQFMAHALEIPNEMMGLGNRISVALTRKNGRYLGSYSPIEREIALPGRSNSFAHEWFHALDHMLVDRLGSVSAKALETMWSRAVRGGDLIDRAQSLKPVEQAFVDLLNTLFFDKAQMAAEVLRLSNSHAQDAQVKLDRLLSGASQARSRDSAFVSRVKNATNKQASYWANAPEMMARSFEAYVAHKVQAAGGGNAFITKGDDAYQGDADLKLIDMYPSLQERAEIFAAFDELFHQLRNEHVFGNAAAAIKPNADNMISAAHYHKVVSQEGPPKLQAQLKQEYLALARSVSNMNQKGVLKQLKEAYRNGAARVGLPEKLQRGAFKDTLSGLLFSIRGRLSVLEKRNREQGGDFLGWVRDKIATRPGEGRYIGVVFEEDHERVAQKVGSRIDDAISALGLRDLKTGFLSAENNTLLRELLLGQTNQTAKRELVDLAAEIRQIMNDLHADAVAAGVELGFVSDTGYLMRILQNSAVDQNTRAFTEKAAEVYELVFDRDFSDAAPNALLQQAKRLIHDGELHFHAPTSQKAKALRAVLKLQKKGQATDAQVAQAADMLRAEMRSPWSRAEADDWKQKIIVGSGTEYATRGPDASPTQGRSLPPEADTILKDFLVSDALDATMQYAYALAQRTAYARRAGKISGNTTLDAVMRRPENAQYLNDPKFDRDTPAGQLAILDELTDLSKDDVIEMAFGLAGRNGTPSADIKEARGLWNTVTGRVTGDSNPALNRFTSTTYTLGLLTLLPRAVWTAGSEPLAVLARGGGGKAAIGTLGGYMRALTQWIGTTQNTRDLMAMSKALGLIATPLFDNVLMNRMNADFDQQFSGEKLLSRFFQANLLTPVTNAQRQAVLRGAHIHLLDLVRLIRDPDYSKAENISAGKARAELRELGVSDGQMDAFADWLLSLDADYIPSVDALSEPMGKLWGEAASRFVDTTIMNPRRVDKAASAMSNYGRVVFALTSFIYKFTQEIHLAALARVRRNAGISQDARTRDALKNPEYWKALAPEMVQFAAGFTLLFAGQLLQTTLREAIFSQERWSEMEEEDELIEWLSRLAFSRTGVLGVGDILWNVMTGLRYERDMTSLTAGAGLGYYLSNLQNVINGVVPNLPVAGPALSAAGVGGRNAPTTLTAERTALKSAYRLIAVPAISFGMSMLPTAGPVSRAAITAAMQYGTSASPASGFAETFIPED